MANEPEYKLYPELFNDGVMRRSIVISGYLTKAENDQMKARAQAAGIGQIEYMQECLRLGIAQGTTQNINQGIAQGTANGPEQEQ